MLDELVKQAMGKEFVDVRTAESVTGRIIHEICNDKQILGNQPNFHHGHQIVNKEYFTNDKFKAAIDTVVEFILQKFPPPVQVKGEDQEN